MKQTPLQRKTGLITRKSMARNNKPIPAKKPAKPGAAAQEKLARDLVYARSGGYCEIRLDGCLNVATDWHHRKNRSQSGPWTASNGLHACRHCHHAVTDTQGNRPLYERRGWIVSRDADPADVPVVLWPVGLAYLDNLGDYWQPDPFSLPVPDALGAEGDFEDAA